MIGWGSMPGWMDPGSLVTNEEPKRRSLAGVISDTWRKRQADRMVAALLEPACPVCNAEPGAWCDYRHPDFGPHTQMLQLDTELLVCSARAQIAIDAGRLKLSVILKRMPDWSPPPSLRPAR